MADEPGRVGVDALVAVDEPERDERPEDEPLRADGCDVGALQGYGRPRAGTWRR